MLKFHTCLVLLPTALGASAFPAALENAQTASVNSIDMRFALIPAGEFRPRHAEAPEMLAAAYPHYQRKRAEEIGDEQPLHRVRITRAFHLGQHEVTVGQFRRFMEETGYVPESQADGSGGYGYNPQYDPTKSPRGDAFEGRDPKYAWSNPGFAQGEDHPVVNVTWYDAVALCGWLSRREGRTYRLPTEAEWEYAARAGTTTRFHSGNDPQSLLKVANIFDTDSAANWERWKPYALKGADGYAFTAPVGSFAPNAWGLFDMHGNVWEWTSDWYSEDYYARSPLHDPVGPATGRNKVRRGGSWHTWSFYARSSYRNINSTDTRYTLLGMRLVLEK
jgi:sulfatase modifying factor 1